MKARILLADDDHDLVMTLKRLLEFHGFQIFTAYEGVRVMELAKKKKPDLIILDIKMPAGDGHTILQNLRSQDETSGIPVLILTGLEETNLEEEMKSAGAQEFLKKPYDSEELLQKVESLIHEK